MNTSDTSFHKQENQNNLRVPEPVMELKNRKSLFMRTTPNIGIIEERRPSKSIFSIKQKSLNDLENLMDRTMTINDYHKNCDFHLDYFRVSIPNMKIFLEIYSKTGFHIDELFEILVPELFDSSNSGVNKDNICILFTSPLFLKDKLKFSKSINKIDNLFSLDYFNELNFQDSQINLNTLLKRMKFQNLDLINQKDQFQLQSLLYSPIFKNVVLTSVYENKYEIPDKQNPKI